MADKQFYAYIALARQQLAQHNPQLALDTLKEAAKLEPNDATVHQLLAHASYEYFRQTGNRQHHKTAKESIRISIHLAPDNAHSFYLQSLIFRSSHLDWDQRAAKAALAQALKLDPDNPDYLIAEGDYYKDDIFSKHKAIRVYKRALELAPTDAYVLSQLGNYYYFLENDTEAAEIYARDALKYEPQNPIALVVMGHILYKKGKHAEAHEHAILVLSQNPRDRDALKLVALLEGRKNILLWISYRLWLALQRPLPALLSIVIFLMVIFTLLYIGGALSQSTILPDLDAPVPIFWQRYAIISVTGTSFTFLFMLVFAQISLNRRVQKYLADFQLKRNF